MYGWGCSESPLLVLLRLVDLNEMISTYDEQHTWTHASIRCVESHVIVQFTTMRRMQARPFQFVPHGDTLSPTCVACVAGMGSGG